eukprot:11940344-Ditylum_brightwellii.AAC.1
MGKNPPTQSNDKNKENNGETRCCSGSVCTRASDPLLSGYRCPVCKLEVHPLCEVWSSPHQQHICHMCDTGMGEEDPKEQKNPVSPQTIFMGNTVQTVLVGGKERGSGGEIPATEKEADNGIEAPLCLCDSGNIHKTKKHVAEVGKKCIMTKRK